MHGLDDVVSKSWRKPMRSNGPLRRLHAELSCTVLASRAWNKKIKASSNLVFNVANEVIFNLDLAMEERELSVTEWELHRTLKARLLGIAAVEKIMWRQRLTISKIKASDASSKLFHLRANGRRRKNHIPVLRGQNGDVNEHKLKEELLFNHFKSLLGTSGAERKVINRSLLPHTFS